MHSVEMNKRVTALEAEILAQAEAKASEIMRLAERVAQRITKSAERKAEEIRSETESRLAPKLKAERERALALVELEARREEAARREALIEEILSEAKVAVSRWRERADADAILARIIAEAISALPGEHFKVELPPADMKRMEGEPIRRLERELSERLKRPVHLELAPSNEPFSGGARVFTADRRIMADETFEARFDRMAVELRRRIAQALFGQ